MATHDYVIDNSTGANVRADINNVLQAILTNNSNSSAPSTTAAYMLWADTTANIVKIRNSANNAWINLFTTAGGIDVDAASNFNEDVTFTGASYNLVWDKSDNALEFADNAKAVFGTGSDLQIYHSGSHSYIIDAGTGDFVLQGSNIYLNSADNQEHKAIFKDNGAVELYYDNSKKFETTSTGGQISNGTGDAQLNIRGGSSDGKATIQFITDDSASNDDNFRLRNDASNDFYLQNYASGSWETNIKAVGNGAVELYYDNSKKLSTQTWGVQIYGDLIPSGDNTRDLGASNERWAVVYAANGSIQTSDKNEKNTIVESDLGLDFVNQLKPISYKWNKNDGKTHNGLIAQDLEETIKSVGKTIADFGGIYKEPNSPMGLSYTELIAPLIKAVQELSAKVAALEAA